MTFTTTRRTLLGGAALLVASPALLRAQTRTLNLYSSRHYDTDEALYSDFTKQTGITINRVEAGEDPLLARMQSEGANSPADVLITVDAGRIEKAQSLGLLQPFASEALASRIPANLRDPDGNWFGFSTRARVFLVARDKVPRAPSAPTRTSPTRSGRARCSSARRPTSTTSRSPARSWRPWPGEDRGLGPRRRCQPRPSAARRRQRPDPRRGRRRGRHRGQQHLLFRPSRRFLEARGSRGRREAARRLPEPGRPRHPREHLGRRHRPPRQEYRCGKSLPRISGHALGTALFRLWQHEYPVVAGVEPPPHVAAWGRSRWIRSMPVSSPATMPRR